MRRLWMTRRRSAAACLAKMRVWIEDPEGETAINGIPCRKLGELKNGEKKAFAVGTEAARVFVTADRLTRNLYNEFTEIPAGEDDVVLAGQNRLKPFSGNPFHFDGTPSAAVLENRRSTVRRGKLTMTLGILAGVLAGCIGGAAGARSALLEVSFVTEERVFAAEELRIVLPETFRETEAGGYTACFTDGDAAVCILREEPDPALFGELSLRAYGAMILANNGFGPEVQLVEDETLTTFEAVLTGESGEEYRYYCGLFRSQEAYWMVQITTPPYFPEERRPQLRQWLLGVGFEEA